MTGNDDGVVGNGERGAKQRQRRVWLAILLPGLVALGVLLAIKQGLGGSVYTGPSQMDPRFAVAFAIVIVLFTLVGATWHHRVVDEQEERAILWGSTVGFYTVVVLAMIADAFEMAGLIEPVSHVATIVGGLAVSLAVYLWHRFR